MSRNKQFKMRVFCTCYEWYEGGRAKNCGTICFDLRWSRCFMFITPFTGFEHPSAIRVPGPGTLDEDKLLEIFHKAGLYLNVDRFFISRIELTNNSMLLGHSCLDEKLDDYLFWYFQIGSGKYFVDAVIGSAGASPVIDIWDMDENKCLVDSVELSYPNCLKYPELVSNFVYPVIAKGDADVAYRFYNDMRAVYRLGGRIGLDEFPPFMDQDTLEKLRDTNSAWGSWQIEASVGVDAETWINGQAKMA